MKYIIVILLSFGLCSCAFSADTKVGVNLMEETYTPAPVKVVHNYDDLVAKKKDLQAQVNELNTIISDIDGILARMTAIGIKPLVIEKE